MPGPSASSPDMRLSGQGRSAFTWFVQLSVKKNDSVLLFLVCNMKSHGMFACDACM